MEITYFYVLHKHITPEDNQHQRQQSCPKSDACFFVIIAQLLKAELFPKLNHAKLEQFSKLMNMAPRNNFSKITTKISTDTQMYLQAL